MLLEVARGLGDLVRSGWQPARSIIICSWDAEEYGLIGSIEFVERYLPSLTARAVAYFNVDIAVSGLFLLFPSKLSSRFSQERTLSPSKGPLPSFPSLSPPPRVCVSPAPQMLLPLSAPSGISLMVSGATPMTGQTTRPLLIMPASPQ